MPNSSVMLKANSSEGYLVYYLLLTKFFKIQL